MITDMEPEIAEDGVPWCNERCRYHDGKRCQILGEQPARICEPAVADMAAMIRIMEKRP